MSLSPEAGYIVCSECGAYVAAAEADEHVCDAERQLDYQLAGLRPGIDRFESDFRDWLATPAGRFELFYAERCRPPRRVMEWRRASATAPTRDPSRRGDRDADRRAA